MIAEGSLLFHLDHPVNWTPRLFHQNGKRFIDLFFDLPGRMPGDFLVEIQRCAQTALSDDDLRRFGQWCFHRLRRLAESIPVCSSRNDAALLAALVAILPDRGVFGELKSARTQFVALAEAGLGTYVPSPIARTNAEATLSDRLERAGNALAGQGPSALFHRAASELELYDFELQASWGGPFNGQSGRQQLFRDLAARLRFDTVIETGTYRATTAEWIARNFDLDVYTCEINARLFHQAKAKLAGLANARIELDDSVAFLTRISAMLSRRSNILIYLDAHWLDRLPLADELATIRRCFRRAVVMIDDFEIPTDPGYGFDTYGPGKRVGLALLRGFCDHCSVFLPTLPSANETGARRGVAVLTWDRKLGPELMRVPGCGSLPTRTGPAHSTRPTRDRWRARARLQPISTKAISTL